MSIPDYQSVMLPFLEALQDGKERTMRELTEQLAIRFRLTEDERRERLPSGQSSIFNNRVSWAKTYLKNAGLINNTQRGRVTISDDGRGVVSQNLPDINSKFLKQYPSFQKFVSQPVGESGNGKDIVIAETVQTPQEQLDESFKSLRKATAEELLGKLKQCSPAFFELVVLRLLRAMGYGGVKGNAVHTGRSGDGGIDGIIYEDKLGLGLICVQAKKWEGPVGRPVVQTFVGSMDFHRGKKGVLLTTSQFTKDAMDYVDRIEGKKVVLIGGPELADLMIEHNIGVKPKELYELKEVSYDFFDEDEG